MMPRTRESRQDRPLAWGVIAALCVGWILAPRLYSEERLNANRYKSGQTIRRVFRDVATDSQKAVVEIYKKDKWAALGVVMDSDGHLLTKASELDESPICKFRDGTKVKANVVAIDRDTDLALLKIESDGLTAIVWDTGDRPAVGQWFVTPGLKELPLAVGIVSVAKYSIPPNPGVLGITISDDDNGARITKVYSNSGAAKAGLKVDDVVTKVADEIVKTGGSLSARVRKFRPGDSIKLLVLRDKKELEIRATLGYPRKDMNIFRNRGSFQNRLGGELSRRRGGFNSIIQHDSVLAPNECGGPVIGLSGKAVGLNIARGGRTESYALPTETVLKTYRNLKAEYASVKKEGEVGD